MKTVVFVRSSRALCLLLLLLHLNSRAQGVGPNAAPAGRVVGQVLDFDPQKPEFVIEGAGVKQAVRVDEDGNYKVKLPPGVYRILTPGGSKAVPPSHVFRRASFR